MIESNPGCWLLEMCNYSEIGVLMFVLQQEYIFLKNKKLNNAFKEALQIKAAFRPNSCGDYLGVSAP